MSTHHPRPKLLQVYKDVDEHIKTELKNCSDIACHKGCDACCKRSSAVYVIQPEAFNMIDEIRKKATTEVGKQVLEQMKAHTSETEICPFLVDSECAVYDARPLACRTYYVHGTPCTQEEVAHNTRLDDMHQWDVEELIPLHRPLVEHLYGLKYPEAQDRAFRGGALAKNAYPMDQIHWALFAEAIENQTSSHRTSVDTPDSDLK